MTQPPSAYGTDKHPEVSEISALTEGLLSPEQSETLRAHLAACDLCADVRMSLAEISETLGTLPGPPRMPSDVAGRIDAALAAEALLDTAAPSTDKTTSGEAVSRETEEPGDDGLSNPAETPVRVSRETGSARPRPAPSVGRPPRRGRAATGPAEGYRSRRRVGILMAACTVAVLGTGGLVLQSFLNPAPVDTAHHKGSAPSGQPEDAGLEKHVHTLLAEGSPKTSPSPGVGTKQSPDSPMSGGNTTVPSCVRESINRTETPLAVDESVDYRGGTGYLVVLPHPGGPGGEAGSVDAYVVDKSCVKGETSRPGDVLLQRTYPRR